MLLMIGLLGALPADQSPTTKPRFVPFSEAQPILEAVAEVLPPELKDKPLAELSRSWPSWIAQRDTTIRARLLQGDEDSIVNFLLFGTSFTRQPRLTGRQILLLKQRTKGNAPSRSNEPAKPDLILEARIQDLIKGLIGPGNNERLLFARELIVRQKSLSPASADGRNRISEYLHSSLERVLSEQSSYLKALEEARLLSDASEQFYERSRLYRHRGLSVDTSLLPNFALEEALKRLKDSGLLKDGGVRRIAVIGPGLDFTDKQEGYDFYPPQSIQAFAVINSLLKLGLAKLGNLEVDTFDLSPRVNDHLARAKSRAQKGESYTVQLPRNLDNDWKEEAVRYWERFGDQIGTSVVPVSIPTEATNLKVRAVRIRPEVVMTITARDLNVVTQRFELASADRFDLIIATNILVYYDTFEQSLAMANIESMLSRGAFLLSNNALLELPFAGLKSVDYLTVVYSARPDDGDHIIWYQNRSN